MPSRTILNKLVGLAVLFLLPVAVAAGETVNQARVAISPERVADAMASAGLTADRTQVEFLSEVTAKADSSSLQVVSVSRTLSGTVGVKLRCRENSDCLPFYVLVHNLIPSGFSPIPPRAEPLVGRRKEALARAIPDIRGGDHATLIIENADLRISLPVICMQNGVRGQRIRVASKDHWHFFEGEVVAAGMLRGNL